MRQDADPRPRRGKEAAQRIVEAQAALIGQAQDRRRREVFGDGRDRVRGVRRWPRPCSSRSAKPYPFARTGRPCSKTAMDSPAIGPRCSASAASASTAAMNADRSGEADGDGAGDGLSTRAASVAAGRSQPAATRTAIRTPAAVHRSRACMESGRGIARCRAARAPGRGASRAGPGRRRREAPWPPAPDGAAEGQRGRWR